MRTKYVETYHGDGGFWHAVTTDAVAPVHTFADTELEALGALCDKLWEQAVEQAGYPEEWV